MDISTLINIVENEINKRLDYRRELLQQRDTLNERIQENEYLLAKLSGKIEILNQLIEDLIKDNNAAGGIITSE